MRITQRSGLRSKINPPTEQETKKKQAIKELIPLFFDVATKCDWKTVNEVISEAKRGAQKLIQQSAKGRF